MRQKQITIFFASLILCSAMHLCFTGQIAAQTNKTVLLWPDGAPGANGTEEKDKPKLHISVPAKQNGTAIVILPGGGYRHLAMGHEGKDIAKWFNSLGIATFICDYRHRGKGYGHPAPMQDAQRAIQWVRSQAKKWNIEPNRIGVIGFSAGGHLASTVSNHIAKGNTDASDLIARQSSRPDFAILCYPVIAFGEPFAHLGSQRNLLGNTPTAADIKKYSNEKQVTAQTPPTFLWSTADDRVVKVQNCLSYFQSLRKYNVPAELHVYPTGRHGLGMAKGNASVSKWTTACENWLHTQGLMTKNVLAKNQKLFFVFLTTGKSAEGVAKEKIAKLQEAHLANFRRLAEAGKLLAVGPTSDPDKKIRGIVLLRAANKSELPKMFDDDPCVQQQFLKVQSHPAKIQVGSLDSKGKPVGMEEYRMVILKRQKSPSVSDNIKQLRQQKRTGELLLAMNLEPDQQIAIFKKRDDKKIKKNASQIANGQKTKIIPLYMGKGIFD